MKTMMCNVLITRRQQMVFIENEDGTLLWSGKEVHSAIVFLIDEGQPEFRLVDGDDAEALHITARRV